jgi:anti-sigma factor RsiW
MKCENIFLYVNGELDASQRAAFKQHLQTCAACRRQLQFLEQADIALAAKAAPEEVVNRLFAKTTRKRRFLTGWKPVLAGIVAASVLGFLFLPSSENNTAIRTEVLAYMQYDLDEDYQNFANDLALFESEF